MGTISDKLEYLGETKDELRDGINDLVRASNEIDEDDTFRSYVEPLRSIRDRLPKVEGEGEDITLNDTIEARMRKTLQGNTSQVQYSGKQLIPYDLADIKTSNQHGTWSDNKFTYNGITFEFNDDGSVKATGSTSSSNAYVRVCNAVPLNGSLTLSSGLGTSTNYYARALDRNNGYATLMRTDTSSDTATINTSVQVVLYIKSDLSNINVLFKPMIRLSSVSDDTYEPYVGSTSTNITPSPNPDYPQDIHSVSGDNEIVVCGKNLFDDSVKNNIWVGYNGVISSEGSNCKKIYCSGGDKFTISGTYESASGSGALVIAFFDKDNNMLSRNAVGTNTSITISQTAPQNTAYMYAGHYIGEPLTIQLEKGLTATTYEPYTGNTYPLYLGVENLFNKNGTLTSGYIRPDGTLSESVNFSHTDYIPIQPNTPYTTSGMTNGTGNEPSRVYYDSSKTFISSCQHSNATNIIDTSPSNAYYMIESVRVADLDTIQIEKGTKANHYTPYGTTPIEMRGINTYKDSFYKALGKKNLFDVSSFESQLVSGKILNDNGIEVSDSTSSYSKYVIPVKAGTTYYRKGAWQRMYIYDTNMTLITRGTGVTGFDSSFTIEQDGYIGFQISNSYWSSNKGQEQIELGSIATPYEPYGNGEWYKKENIGKVVLDGSETWKGGLTGGVATNYKYLYTTVPAGILSNVSINNPYSTRFQCAVVYQSAPVTSSSLGIAAANVDNLRILIDENVINNPATEAEAITNLKTWLSTHNTKVKYVLATPTYTKVTDNTLIEQLDTAWYSQDGQTNISQENNDQPFWLEVDALKDSDIFH